MILDNLNLLVFYHSEPGVRELRTVLRDGEPWFVTVDVCRALEVKNARDAVARLDDDEKNTVVLTDGNRGNPNVTIVNEPGLYTLVLGSRKPEAKATVFSCPAHLRFREKKRCESAIPVIFPPIGQKSYVYKA